MLKTTTTSLPTTYQSMTKENAVSKNKNRRSFLRGALTAGGASAFGAPNLAAAGRLRLTKGDAAILKFLAAAELIEADLWQQYAELGGLTAGTQNTYQLAFQQFDGDGSQYITS